MKLGSKVFLIGFLTSLVFLRIFAQCTLEGRSSVEPSRDSYNGRCRAGAFIYGSLWFLHTDYGSFEDEKVRDTIIQILDQAFDLTVVENDLDEAKSKIENSISWIKKKMHAGTQKDIYLCLLYGAIYMLNHVSKETTKEEAIEVLYNVAYENAISSESVDKFVAGDEPQLDERRRRLFHQCDPGHNHSASHEITVCFVDWLLAKLYQ